ncbi:phage tail-collar fiber domain-containing protein [Pseudoalteromonas undina]|uniref:phage tail-collar fiber domain-containing protein n=1 Tax=Pseudoalteromonas undina TaxID=43660 RepID=UPI0018686B7E|nr:phage tail protein [Pseudoalteromonas undina]
MAQVITLAGEKLFAAKAQANQQLDIDTFIFANVAGQDSTAAIDRNEEIPTGSVVFEQNVQQTGRINDNVVVYSTVLDSLTGPFEFNWVGLYSSVNQTLVAISHVPTVAKTITAPGSAGNTLNRNFGIEYSGIADLAGISVSPETWQLDFSARLSGMDELTRQLASDMNGKDWFIDDGFKVVSRSTANTFSVTPGIGYVSGLRVELKNEQILTLQSYPQFVYVDAYFDGNASSTWKPKVAFTVSNTEIDDYIDVNGTQHYVLKIAKITSFDTVEDLRNINGLKQQIENHINETESAHKASAISLAVKDALSNSKLNMQDTSDWYGVYLSQFLRDGEQGMSHAFNRALEYCRNLPYKGTRIIFERGALYKYDDDHIIGNLSNCMIDLNGSTVQRRSSSTFSSTTTQVIPAGTGLNAREIYVADASKFKVGDFVYSIKGVGLDNISSDAREIQSIAGNKLTIAGAFYYRGTQYGSNTPTGVTICKRVRFIGGGGVSSAGDYNDKIVLCNGELDGNGAAQPSQAWVFNAEINLSSNRGAIYGMTFRNTAAECITGHGIDVNSNQFFDMGGSCFHLSVHDNSLDKTGGSWFRNNQCERTNLATQAVSGHAEGLVTFSWGAGRLVVADNICKDGTEPFLGAFGSPTEDNPDKYLVVHGNTLERFPTFMSYLAADAVGVSIKDNILIETGVAPQVQEAIYANPSIKCSGNISVGSNGRPTLENVSRNERLAIGNDVQLQARQRAVISDPNAHAELSALNVPNPINAQLVLQGVNSVITEHAARVSADYKRSIYTAGGPASSTASETWDEKNKQLRYSINPKGGSGGSFAWTTYSGGTRKHLEVDDEGVAFNRMQYGNATYYGEKHIDGSWRVIIESGNLLHQKRVDGVWVTKQTVAGQ